MLAAMDTIARKPVLDLDAEWALIQGLLPKGWQAKAKELGAVRRLRGIGSIEALLRVLLVHLAGGCSLKETALRALQAGLGKVSAVGIFKRLRVAGPWLAWMAAALWGGHPPVAGRRCLAVDATTVREHGVTGSLYRVHWCVNLANLHCEFLELTDVHGGEKFARFPVAAGDLILADRGYSNANGVDHVCRHGGDVLLRANPPSLPMYHQPGGAKLKVLAALKDLKIGQVRELSAWVQGPEGRWHRGRLVAVKRSRAATWQEIRRGRRKASKSGGHKLGKHARKLAGYILVWTSLPPSVMPAPQVLASYRQRWQLELVFKRVKSIMGLGQLPKRSDASSRAWLHGKLLVAMLIEKLWQHAEHFSPWGYDLPEPA